MAKGGKLRLATTSLAGSFGCHMSLLDIDERVFELLKKVEFDRSPLTDIKHCGPVTSAWSRAVSAMRRTLRSCGNFAATTMILVDMRLRCNQRSARQAQSP